MEVSSQTRPFRLIGHCSIATPEVRSTRRPPSPGEVRQLMRPESASTARAPGRHVAAVRGAVWWRPGSGSLPGRVCPWLIPTRIHPSRHAGDETTRLGYGAVCPLGPVLVCAIGAVAAGGES
nr:unnamed protein product [Digitaria exilis]